MVKKEAKKEEKALEKLCKELFSLMGVKINVDITKDIENDAFLVNLQTEQERGLLIGKKGETINAIQTALGMMLKQSVGEWKRVIVNIGDWREKQEGYLKDLALRAAERAKETKDPQSLYNLDASQRRVIHMLLKDVDGVTTESTGEGRERCLVVKPDETKK